MEDEKPKSMTSVINEMHFNDKYTFGNNQFGPPPGSPLTPSINLSSAYAFRSVEDLEKYHENANDFVRYARDTNSVARQCEEYLSTALSGQNCFVFSSGMSAIEASLAILLPKREIIITVGTFYRKTQILIEKYSKLSDKRHIHINLIDELHNISKSIDVNKSIILVENFSNPYLTVIDIEKLKYVYPECCILLDFTMQGLLNSSQHEFADISVTSCTKYIGGHNDLLAGAVFTANNHIADEIWAYRSASGGILNPFNASLMLRSLRTYDMRIEKQLKNTAKVLNYLEKENTVQRLFYPFAHENKYQSDIANKFSHGGSVISFEVAKDINLEKNISNLRSMKMAPSFGSVDTLIEIPAYMSKRNDNNTSNKEGITSLVSSLRFIRLSIGCEPIKFLLNDLEILLS